MQKPMIATIKKVDWDRVFIPKTGKYRKLKYSDIVCDADGWVDAKQYLPMDFDLVYMRTEKGIYVGWSIGKKWDGIKHSKKDKILYWKRKIDV